MLVFKMFPYKYRHFAAGAAEAALAARDQGKFIEMHHIMLENSPKLDRENLLKYAREIGLDMERFTSDLDGMKHKDVIERDKTLAGSLDLFNTPSFFINGRMVIGNVPYSYFNRYIQEELSRLDEK